MADDKDIERLDKRVDKVEGTCGVRHEKLDVTLTELKIMLARMEERDKQIVESLKKGSEIFEDLTARIGLIEKQKIFLKGYSTPLLAVFSVIGVLVVSGLTYGLHKILDRFFN